MNGAGFEATYSSSATPSVAPAGFFEATPSPGAAPIDPTQACTGTVTLSSAAGSFTDGPGQYAANSACEWSISGPGAITLTFSAVALEANYDFVKVYGGTAPTAPLLDALTGMPSSPVTVASPSGQLYVVFSSDGSVNGAGFEATYTSTSGIISSTPTTVPAPVSLNGCPGSTTDYIVAHNAKRTPAGLPAVVYSSTVEAFAQSWANTLQSQGCNMQHSTDDQRSDITHGAGSGVGENLYWSMGLSPTWTSMVDHWWSEIDSYIYGPSGNNCSQPGRAVGHFTQLAWQCSVYVGCARASCGSQAIAVCNYGMAGNLFNVMPFSSSVSVALGKSETPCAGGGQAQTCSAPECLGGSTPSTPSATSAPSSYPRCDNSAVRVMQETSGIFSDGDGNYEANSVCQFKIVSSVLPCLFCQFLLLLSSLVLLCSFPPSLLHSFARTHAQGRHRQRGRQRGRPRQRAGGGGGGRRGGGGGGEKKNLHGEPDRPGRAPLGVCQRSTRQGLRPIFRSRPPWHKCD